MGRVWSRFGSGILQDLAAISPPVGCVRRGGPWLRYCTLRCAACPLEFSPSLIYVLLFGRGVEEVTRRGIRAGRTVEHTLRLLVFEEGWFRYRLCAGQVALTRIHCRFTVSPLPNELK